MSINDLLGSVPKLTRLRILLADDEEVHRMLIGDRLRNAGYEVDEAVDGYDALEKLTKFPYAAAVMDTQMPGLYGYEVCALIREQPLGVDLAIVGVTGNKRRPDFKTKWAQADSDGLLDKSEVTFGPDVLSPQIYSAIQRRRRIY
jgi:CheY-like chemotaxis protein